MSDSLPRPIDYASPAWVDRPHRADPWRRLGGGLTPHLYQRQDAQYILDGLAAGRGMYAGHFVGAGKTLLAAMVMDGGANNFNLVICLNSAKAQWASMLAEYCPWLQVVVVGNTAAQRERALAAAKALCGAGDPFVLICHYEAVAVIDGPKKNGWKPLGSWDLVIIDEAHRLVGRTTKVASAIRRLQRAGVLMLSGSIMTGKGDKLFVPLQILRPKKYRSKWRDWITPYFEVVDNGFASEVGDPWPHKLDELRAELGEVLVVRRASDHIDIPEPHIVEHWVDLYPEQRKVYDELVERLMSELPSGYTVAVTDGSALIAALRQVTGGIGFEKSAKHDRAAELLADTDEQALVFGWHKAVVSRVTPDHITGDVSVAQRAALVDRFRAGEVRTLAATIKTLGESINLQQAGVLVFLEESYVASDNAQALGRVVRQGQSQCCSVHYIRARHTVDGRVLESATTKADLRRLLLGC